MTKKKSTKKSVQTKSAKSKKTAPPVATSPDGAPTGEDLCTFAMRLPRSESAEIHQAAGPGKASRFVRRLAVAAARGEIDEVHRIVGEVVRAK